MTHAIKIAAPVQPQFESVLTPDALDFLRNLQKRFNKTRLNLLKRRERRQAELTNGAFPAFNHNFRHTQPWKVSAPPADLTRRRVEITGPVEPKMMINALNSGADVFMGDFEDALSPSWENVLNGQLSCYHAVRRTLSFSSPEGKQYKLGEKLATLVVRPRGWHLEERHVLVDGKPMSASLFDFGLYFFHNARELVARGSGPYFYLPKMESHREARLWCSIFDFAEDEFNLPRGTICATVLIENILAAFEMDEILYELREHSPALNAGRWDYLFSVIAKFRKREFAVLPDRARVTMNSGFLRAYCELLVQTCHKRGAHAIGGMAAFIPNRRDPAVTEAALTKVRADKVRECTIGFDGTWVAHPDLVAVAAAVFEETLGGKPHQKDKIPEGRVFSADLLRFADLPDPWQVTEAGVRENISVALQYIGQWLHGNGAVAINNLMEDAATAEISRSQLWQWMQVGVRLQDGRLFNRRLYDSIKSEELKNLERLNLPFITAASMLLDRLVLNESYTSFLTQPAYALLCERFGE